MKHKINNIFRLGIKELIGLLRDPLMMILIVYTFTLEIYNEATASHDTIYNAAIAVVDEDNSQLSKRIEDAFIAPYFLPPDEITFDEIDRVLDAGYYTFVLVLPSRLQHDVLHGNHPKIQLNTDATRMTQAFSGGGYIQTIVSDECTKFLNENSMTAVSPISFNIRNRFNMNLTNMWNDSISTLINNITMLAIILTGAALIREREHGTLEHLLVMPVTPFEIMLSKILSMTLVVLIASSVSILLVVRQMLHIPIEGSIPLFLVGVMFHLFAVTALGIMLATFAKNMPQLGMLIILILMPMQMLSGGSSPTESMPEAVQKIMKLAPTSHFVEFSQAILFRGAGIEVVWKPFLCILGLGAAFGFLAWRRFRDTVAS